MKLWKKLTAAVVLTALALTLFTACGSAPQDPGEVTTDVRKVVQWVRESAAEYGVTLEEDETLYEAMRLEVEYDMELEKAQNAQDTERITQLMEEKEAKTAPLWNGRKTGALSFGANSSTHLFEENAVKNAVKLVWPTFCKEQNLANPTKIGGAVMTYQDGSVAALIVFTES